jgi:hypothetical protein
MKLVLEWSTGEYDDYGWFCVPFEWESPEALYLELEKKKEEWQAFRDIEDEKWKLVRQGKMTVEEIDKMAPQPITDIHQHELRIEMFRSYREWACDVSITPLEEWFTR